MKSRDGVIKELKLDKNILDPFESIAKQCKTEYEIAFRHQKPKKDEYEVRLRLYNNQRRDKKAVGDTTMFTIHQTVLASLYNDRLTAIFSGKEQGDEETADNLNALAESDFDDMEKDILDYYLDWDASFFGRGLLDVSEFERVPEKNIFLPLPHNIDPIVFLRDPVAISINGDRKGRGATRFHGFELKMTKDDMRNHPHIFEGLFDPLSPKILFGSGTNSLLRDAQEARIMAQGNESTSREEVESKLGANGQYDITEWSTHIEVGDTVKKVKVWLANERSIVVGIQVLKKDYWQIVDRPLYPHSYDFDGTSIPDLTEDKQRARAIAQNLGLNSMKADLYPMYAYDTNRITNRNDLNFNFNKFIGIDSKDKSVTDAISPLIKARPNMQLLDFVYNSLDASAQKATATPDIQQGIQSQKDRPLGETNLIASNVDTRYSLSAKVFGWSERRFWETHWYGLYKDNFADKIDEKIIRIQSAFGPKWRPLLKDNIIARLDPDVKIESQSLNRAKMMEERQLLTNYFAAAVQDPTVNKRWAMKKLGKLNGLKKDELDRLYPPTVDEYIAEAENDKLNRNEYVAVKAEDDHVVHLEMHSKANETDATKAHREVHIQALSIKKANPGLFPQDPAATQPNQATPTQQPLQTKLPAKPNPLSGGAMMN